MFTHSIALRLQTPRLLIALKILLVLMIAIEVYASLKPIDDTGIDLPHMDKFVHFIMHWANMCLAGVAFVKARSFFWVGVLLFLLGPVIELLQGRLPHRDASLADQLANTLGFLAGLATAKGLLRRK